MDTRLRLLLVLGGLPTPEVFDPAYSGARLAIEYDGTVHGSRVFSADDRWRDATTSGYGWQTVTAGRHCASSGTTSCSAGAAPSPRSVRPWRTARVRQESGRLGDRSTLRSNSTGY
jgi:hypothetical protein